MGPVGLPLRFHCCCCCCCLRAKISGRNFGSLKFVRSSTAAAAAATTKTIDDERTSAAAATTFLALLILLGESLSEKNERKMAARRCHSARNNESSAFVSSIERSRQAVGGRSVWRRRNEVGLFEAQASKQTNGAHFHLTTKRLKVFTLRGRPECANKSRLFHCCCCCCAMLSQSAALPVARFWFGWLTVRCVCMCTIWNHRRVQNDEKSCSSLGSISSHLFAEPAKLASLGRLGPKVAPLECVPPPEPPSAQDWARLELRIKLDNNDHQQPSP